MEVSKNVPKYTYRAEQEWVEDSIRWIDMPYTNFDSLTTINEVDPDKPFGVWETFDVRGYTNGFLRNKFDNHGYVIAIASITGGGYFRSSEYSDVELRPKLELLISDNLSPTITINSPVPEDVIPNAGTAEIKWNGGDDGGISGFALYYSMDFGETWTYIDSVNGLTDSYTWQVPEVVYKSRCYIKIRIYDDKLKSTEGQTYFWIDKPTDNISKTKLFNNNIEVKMGLKTIKFKIPNNFELKSLTVKDVRGRIIENVLINSYLNQNNLKGDYPKGLYFVEANGHNGSKLIQKIVIH